MPQLRFSLPNDHTAGGTKNKPKPTASVADDDLAIGRVVDAVSHSPYWDDTAFLILEDDAQNGPGPRGLTPKHCPGHQQVLRRLPQGDGAIVPS